MEMIAEMGAPAGAVQPERVIERVLPDPEMLTEHELKAGIL